MIIRLGVRWRQAGITHEQCIKHYREIHAPLVRRILPGMVGYIQNFPLTVDGVGLLPYPGFDFCSECEFSSVKAMNATYSSEAFFTESEEDSRQFKEEERALPQAIFDRNVVLREGPSPNGAVKLMSFVTANKSVDELIETMTGEYRDSLAECNSLIRHEVLIARPGTTGDANGNAPFCDVVEKQYFADVPSAMSWMRGGSYGESNWLLAAKHQFGKVQLLTEHLRQW